MHLALPVLRAPQVLPVRRNQAAATRARINPARLQATVLRQTSRQHRRSLAVDLVEAAANLLMPSAEPVEALNLEKPAIAEGKAPRTWIAVAVEAEEVVVVAEGAAVVEEAVAAGKSINRP